jgi:hypothetical protein
MAATAKLLLHGIIQARGKWQAVVKNSTENSGSIQRREFVD